VGSRIQYCRWTQVFQLTMSVILSAQPCGHDEFGLFVLTKMIIFSRF